MAASSGSPRTTSRRTSDFPGAQTYSIEEKPRSRTGPPPGPATGSDGRGDASISRQYGADAVGSEVWQACSDDSAGDNPWENGCREIDEYVKASDLKHWIRRQEAGISESYAKKLVSRLIDALLDLSKHRVAVRKRTERKNGLEYTERRLVLPADAEIPGEAGGET